MGNYGFILFIFDLTTQKLETASFDKTAFKKTTFALTATVFQEHFPEMSEIPEGRL